MSETPFNVRCANCGKMAVEHTTLGKYCPQPNNVPAAILLHTKRTTFRPKGDPDHG